MKSFFKILALGALAPFLFAACESDELIQRQTTTETVTSPYGYGTSTETTTTVIEED